MNSDHIWIALAANGRVRVALDLLGEEMPGGTGRARISERWFRNQLNSEAEREGVSLRINKVNKGGPRQELDVSLRKYV